MYFPIYQILFQSPKPPPNPHFILLLILVILLASAPERFEVCTAVLLRDSIFLGCDTVHYGGPHFYIAYCYCLSLSLSLSIPYDHIFSS